MWVSGTLAFALCAVISKGYAQVSEVSLWLSLRLWGRSGGLNGVFGFVG